MLTCKEASELISAGYDRELNKSERFSLRFHLILCRYCRIAARQIALIQEWVAPKGDFDLSSAADVRLPADARRRITENLTAQLRKS